MEESLENTVEQFKIYLEKQGRSAKTLTSYACSVSMFISLCGELTVENLKRYREYLLKNYQLNTVNTRIYGMNRYLDYLQESGRLPRSRYPAHHAALPETDLMGKTLHENLHGISERVDIHRVLHDVLRSARTPPYTRHLLGSDCSVVAMGFVYRLHSVRAQPEIRRTVLCGAVVNNQYLHLVASRQKRFDTVPHIGL